MKYKIGDIVKIKSNAKEIQTNNWASHMDGCQGQVGIVTWVDDEDKGCSVSTANGFEFFYNNEVLELVERVEPDIDTEVDIEMFSTDDLLKELFRRKKNERTF